MITEDQLEQLAIKWFQETGWSYLPGPTIAPDAPASERADYRAVVLKARLASAVAKLNPKLPLTAVEEVVHLVTTPNHPSLIQSNRALHKLLTDGVKIEYTNAKGEKETDHAQLFGHFIAAKELLGQTPEQADSREALREKLEARQSGGIIFTTVQKISMLYGEKADPVLCDRRIKSRATLFSLEPSCGSATLDVRASVVIGGC